jgi:hypothetical protein
MGAIILQSLHAFHHLEQFVTAQLCNHQYALNKTEISHAHKGFEHCFICEFAFSSSVQIENVDFNLYNNSLFYKSSFLSTSKCISFFSGSSFSLRGPPTV